MTIVDVIEALNPNSSKKYQISPDWLTPLTSYVNKNNNEYVSLN